VDPCACFVCYQLLFEAVSCHVSFCGVLRSSRTEVKRNGSALLVSSSAPARAAFPVLTLLRCCPSCTQVDTIRKYFKEIVICDISASLLEMAQKRINAMGIQDIARVVEHDVTQQSMFAVLPAAGSVDVITMSYSFSMIPDQKAAIANATKVRILLRCL
jgi:hypothetical protein